MSPLMAAIVRYVLDEPVTELAIAELTVSERENLVSIQPRGDAGFEEVQSLEDFRRDG